MSALDLLTFDNVTFRAYVFWSGILLVKILFMSTLTALQRFRNRTFANPEDCMGKKDKVTNDNPYVERVRRAHLNDMENILPFFIAGLLYVLTNPSAFLAINLFRVVAASRIIHTIVYAVVVVPQPARALAFFVAFFCTAYMAVQVIIFAL